MDGDDLQASKRPLADVAADGALAIVAGSDTVATALNHTLYFLLRHPQCMERLREEVISHFPGMTDPSIDFSKQADLPYLNACM